MGIFKKDEYDEVSSWRDTRLANIERKVIDLEGKLEYDIESKLQIILDNQEKNIIDTYDVVILSSNGITRVYDHGKEITDGVSELTFSVDNFPTIKYIRKITPDREV